MKIFIALFAIIAVSAAAPMTLSDNNIGDITYVSVGANGVISSNVEAKLASVLAAFQNQQAVIANGELPPSGIVPASSSEGILKDINITPEIISEVKKIDMIEAIKNAF